MNSSKWYNTSIINHIHTILFGFFNSTVPITLLIKLFMPCFCKNLKKEGYYSIIILHYNPFVSIDISGYPFTLILWFFWLELFILFCCCLADGLAISYSFYWIWFIRDSKINKRLVVTTNLFVEKPLFFIYWVWSFLSLLMGEWYSWGLFRLRPRIICVHLHLSYLYCVQINIIFWFRIMMIKIIISLEDG